MTEQEMVEGARSGDRRALAALVGFAKDRVYNLATRMLGDPVAAEDATQEILIRVVTGLATYRNESSFSTWVYRVATNQILTLKRSRMEQMSESLDDMSGEIAEGMRSNDTPLEDQLVVKEAKLACTSRMVLGLDRDHRLAFILGEVLELAADDGAAALEISPEAFRKRLSRARDRMSQFVQKSCGITNPTNACRCAHQAARLKRLGVFDNPVWTCLDGSGDVDRVAELQRVEDTLNVLRSHPIYRAPERVSSALQELIKAGRSDLWH